MDPISLVATAVSGTELMFKTFWAFVQPLVLANVTKQKLAQFRSRVRILRELQDSDYALIAKASGIKEADKERIIETLSQCRQDVKEMEILCKKLSVPSKVEKQENGKENKEVKEKTKGGNKRRKNVIVSNPMQYCKDIQEKMKRQLETYNEHRNYLDQALRKLQVHEIKDAAANARKAAKGVDSLREDCRALDNKLDAILSVIRTTHKYQPFAITEIQTPLSSLDEDTAEDTVEKKVRVNTHRECGMTVASIDREDFREMIRITDDDLKGCTVPEGLGMFQDRFVIDVAAPGGVLQASGLNGDKDDCHESLFGRYTAITSSPEDLSSSNCRTNTTLDVQINAFFDSSWLRVTHDPKAPKQGVQCFQWKIKKGEDGIGLAKDLLGLQTLVDDRQTHWKESLICLYQEFLPEEKTVYGRGWAPQVLKEMGLVSRWHANLTQQDASGHEEVFRQFIWGLQQPEHIRVRPEGQEQYILRPVVAHLHEYTSYMAPKVLAGGRDVVYIRRTTPIRYVYLIYFKKTQGYWHQCIQELIKQDRNRSSSTDKGS
ncbi:hypothetical protein K432DRAFT_405897 [Lepidopterella palustris CBS 459.81]|uniref:Uncharacterized protein n=1 Tax=Lepidopterella palustris CBS 459.81 TaxID=1314670 RepID=A0A8E2E8A4_9PEZI|nr:hypothetical protein K432DRAFT_405897 [Lepidopterella palustris CBS 459.81]